MSAGTAPFADPEAPGRQVEIVMDNHDFGRRRLVKLGGLPDGSPAQIHIGLRLDEQHRADGPVLRHFRFELLFPGAGVPAADQFVHNLKTYIVTGFFILAAGIAQPHDNFQRNIPPDQVSNRRLTDRSS